MSNIHVQLATIIIKHQENIVGPLSWTQARKVKGLSISDNKVKITGNGKQILADLVKQYSTLFGRASIVACKDAIKGKLPKDNNSDIPDILR